MTVLSPLSDFICDVICLILASTFRWVSVTPFGFPVLPDENWMKAMSSDVGRYKSFSDGRNCSYFVSLI